MSKASQRSENVDWDEGVINYQKNGERRIVLIGKTGTGKSTFGNAILGDIKFNNKGAQMMSNTTVCKMETCKTKEGKDVLVLDTPGLSDTKRPKEEIFEELCKCTTISSPGPHVFCLLIRCDDRFTPECVATLDQFCSFFGEEIFKHLIVVFTHIKELDNGVTIDDCMQLLPEEFQEKFSRYGGKVIGMEFKHISEQERDNQIKDFFKSMEEIITRNGGDYYSDKVFKAVEKAFKEGERKSQEKAKKELEDAMAFLLSEHNKRELEILEREKKLREERDKLEHDMKLSERDKKEKIKSLEEKLEKSNEQRVKESEKYAEKLTDIQEKASEAYCKKVAENRNDLRREAQETKCFSDIAKDMVTGGVGVVAGGITRAVGWLFNW